MLAQNFKSAAELGIDPQIHTALQKVLTRLETGDLVHTYPYGAIPPNGFNMDIDLLMDGCGTVGCLAGWTAVEANLPVEQVITIRRLGRLFYPGWKWSVDYDRVTTEQASAVLRHYLTTGIIDWSEVAAAQQAA